MRDYVIKRLLLFIPVLISVSLLVFVLIHVAPGDIAIVILAGPDGQGRFTETELQELRQRLDLNRPLHEQYLSWVGRLIRLDFGESLVQNTPIGDEIVRRLPVTLELAVLTLLISLALAIPSGIISAIRQDTWADYLLRIVSVGGLAMPVFWTGSLLILVLVLFFRWMPAIGYINFFESPWANLQQMVLPSLALGYFYAAIVSRMMRSQMLEVLRQDYVRTAWAKGLKERVIVLRHALKNAALPVITISAFQFGNLLGGTVIIESLFALPGIGRALVASIETRDFPMFQAMMILLAFWFLLINLIVDILYGWLDPRIRYG